LYFILHLTGGIIEALKNKASTLIIIPGENLREFTPVEMNINTPEGNISPYVKAGMVHGSG
jgi:hypothetical protein